MKDLIPTINDIVKFGLHPNLNVINKEKFLEKCLVKIYNLYFEINFEYDGNEYADFDKSKLPDIVQNVSSNFKDFGYYKSVLDINDLEKFDDIGLGDAVDDLSDIIIDLLEIKWRIENNSLANGIWYFEFLFESHSQQHIINLLNFMKHNN